MLRMSVPTRAFRVCSLLQKGLTTIAPTWFSLADTEGNITSIADTDYVQYAKQAGLEVWAVLRDFHGGINSYDETYEVLSYSSKEQK